MYSSTIVTGGVAAYVCMFISVAVSHGKDIVDILDGWEGCGYHGKGEDAEEVRELHFGVCWVKRGALEKSNWWCWLRWLGFALLCWAGLLGTTLSPECRRGWEFIGFLCPWATPFLEGLVRSCIPSPRSGSTCPDKSQPHTRIRLVR